MYVAAMSSYVRACVPGGTSFFTVNLADRSSDLLVREVGHLRAAFREVRREHPFEVVAVCVLPEHLHAIWTLPPGVVDFGLRWQQIKRRFSSSLEAGRLSGVQSRRREKGIWQRRYWEHQIRDDEDLANHVAYIHFNPVKHGHARQVRDWPYSSFHQWVRRGDLPESWGLVQAADGVFGERR